VSYAGLMRRRVRKMLSRESVAVVRYEVFQQCVHVCSLAACECTRRQCTRVRTVARQTHPAPPTLLSARFTASLRRGIVGFTRICLLSAAPVVRCSLGSPGTLLPSVRVCVRVCRVCIDNIGSMLAT